MKVPAGGAANRLLEESTALLPRMNLSFFLVSRRVPLVNN